jgi:hypothetical protein
MDEEAEKENSIEKELELNNFEYSKIKRKSKPSERKLQWKNSIDIFEKILLEESMSTRKIYKRQKIEFDEDYINVLGDAKVEEEIENKKLELKLNI